MPGLQVKSDLFPGVVFKGTAESIYAEMKALKPDSVDAVTTAAQSPAFSTKDFQSVNLSSPSSP